jgi:hypothetical protein
VFSGVQLTLLIGSLGLPGPASLPLMEALQSVQVTEQRDRTGFQITFTLGKRSPLQTMLQAGQIDPMVTRVVIAVIMNGTPTVLCDGVVTRHEVTPSNQPGQSTLTLTGDDLTVLMDLEQVRKSWANVSHSQRVRTILDKYGTYGISKQVVEARVVTVRNSDQGADAQTVTDLAYVKEMARLSGYTFYLQPGPALRSSVAYFGPDLQSQLTQPALSVNSDWVSNVESLSFSLDGLTKRNSIIKILDPQTRRQAIEVSLPSIDLLNPPLGLRLLPPARTVFSEDLTRLSNDEANWRALGIRREGADTVSANGTLNVPRYGAILRSRALVGVRGAGETYDGRYYVDTVTHNIKAGQYTESFTLSRDGQVSQTPSVPVGGEG